MRLGLFGGAFDPIHNHHLFIAEAVRVAAGLDRIVFLPTGAAVHRDATRASIDDRCAMLRVAIAANPHFALDLSDTGPESTGFTADLIPRLRASYKGAELSFIVGADSIVRSRWARFDEIVAALDAFLIAPRGDVAPSEVEAALDHLDPALRSKARLIALPRVSESASLVRELLDARASVRYLVPEPVWRFLETHRPYDR